ARFADRRRHVREEFQVDRARALRDDEEQHEGERSQRDDHCRSAEGDEERRQQLAATRVRHAAAPPAGAPAAASCNGARLRVMLQMRSRDSELTINVMTNRTRPISTSAARYS